MGRKADGWLVSLPGMESGGLPKRNAIIAPARVAGRDPARSPACSTSSRSSGHREHSDPRRRRFELLGTLAESLAAALRDEHDGGAAAITAAAAASGIAIGSTPELVAIDVRAGRRARPDGDLETDTL